MTLEEIHAALDKIEEVKNDDERAHELEDQLYEDFINHVSISGGTDHQLAEKASLVLESRMIPFERWCA